MKKTISFITLFILIILKSNITLAESSILPYSKQIRGKIMDNFKQEQYNNFFNNNDFVVSQEDLYFFDLYNSSSEKKDNLLKIGGETQKLIEEKETISSRVITLEETINELDSDIENTLKEIQYLSSSIKNLDIEINKTREEITNLKEDINKSTKIILEYISHIYKRFNANSNSGDIDSLKAILLNGGDLNMLLSDLYYSSIIEATGQILIEKHKTLIKDLFVKNLELEKNLKQLSEYRRNELSNRRALIEKRDFRSRILEYTKGQESKFQEYIMQNKQKENSLKIDILKNQITINRQKKVLLEKYGCEYIDVDNLVLNSEFYDFNNNFEDEEVDDATKCINFNKILQAEARLLSSNIDGNIKWPGEPIYGLSAYYKDESYLNAVGTTHDAIDLILPQGSDIFAPADGYVIFIKPPLDETYSYFALKHADGFVSVYGHVNEIYVDMYDFVKAGDLIAKSGGSIGTNGAGLMTSGPHLHFELFRNRVYVDPLDYLDLTYLGEDNIPQHQKYFYKFKKDFENKYGYEFDLELNENIKLFTLEGETEVERQRYLLNSYAIGDFRNWDMWVEESLAGNIDPSFIMCIGLAETGLGRNLKTPYNVGNIGNTDSGSTWDLPNARSGVYWIAKTLNNRFLGEYDKMSQLSRYGNKEGAIYASSPRNWQNNMLRCLSALKDRHIPDDYNFRIGN